MGDSFLIEISHKSAVAVPVLLLAFRLGLQISIYLRRRDWYLLYLGLSSIGVEFSVLAAVLFAVAAVCRPEHLVGPDTFGGASDTAPSIAMFLVVLILSLSIVLTFWLLREARNIARDRLAVISKIPYMERHLPRAVLQSMISDQDLRVNSRDRDRSCAIGYVWCLLSTAFGVGAMSFALILIA